MYDHGREYPGKVLVLGIGNVLMGDEGVGVHLIRTLRERNLPEGVDLLDGGTAGFELLGWIERYPRVIMVDATLDGQPAGTIRELKPRFSAEFPKAMSTHDIGLKDLVSALDLLGKLPEISLLVVSIEALQPMKTDLSAEVAASLKPLAERVLDIVASDLPGLALKDA